MDFVIAGAAAVGAGFFTNPLEVLKTRMQLQGELHAKGEYKIHYRNTIHATYNIVKHDGILSLQKGLAPALYVQFILNGVRLGIYQTLEGRYVLDSAGNTVFYKSVLIGGIGGVAGQIACSPIFLVKTHLQTQSSKDIAVGYQHKYHGMFQGMKLIFKEQGFMKQTSLKTKGFKDLISKRYFPLRCSNESFSMDFLIAGGAAMTACFFTNPLEVLKTRMQLQGELSSKGKHKIHYRNVVHAGYVVAANDGILALQKGLVPALWVQLIMNGMRLGTFQFAENRGHVTDKQGNLIFYKSVLVGGAGGVIGQIFASPFFLVKTHLQSQAVQSIAVGHQHNHRGTWSALKTTYFKNGIKGLFRGVWASVPRAFVGSTSQLTSFKYSKEFLNQYEYFSGKSLLTSFCASMVGGIAISVAMTPFDLVMTRLYNQPVDANGKGILYTNYVDCVIKIFKTEGVSAFYKGVGPMYLRLGPHTVLCLVLWDEFKKLHDNYWPFK